MEEEILINPGCKALDSAKAMLDQFKRLPIIEFQDRTFMEIAGFPHYENVCSNILAFYFDPSQAHKLQSLFLESLLKLLSGDKLDVLDLSLVTIKREEVTSTNKRIDLVIACPSYVIAIENKIFASLYNDLNLYSHHIELKYSEVPCKMKVVLSLNEISLESLSGGFVNITYKRFFEQIKLDIGKFILKANSKYITYLTDFISTMQNLNQAMDINASVREFFITNKEQIATLIEEDKGIKQSLANKIKEIRDYIQPQAANVKQWIWQGNYLVHDLLLADGIKLAIDCKLELDGYEITVFLRDNSNPIEYFSKISFFNSIVLSNESLVGDNRFLLYGKVKLPYPSKTIDVAEKINDLLAGVNK